MSDSPKIHVVDFSSHGEAYDYCMGSCSRGDFVELDNGDVVAAHQGWPVLLTGSNSQKILHNFTEDFEWERLELLDAYNSIKQRNDPDDFVRLGASPAPR